MDKTISISLGGFSFIVDDRAFNKLKSYLDEIRFSLNNVEGTDDIIADVESRIAELFKERLGVREVVNELDVDHIIQIMGKPEQYVDEDTSENSFTQSNPSFERPKRKLYRDPDDSIIAGVLSGIANYLGIEPWITRVLWIVLFFADSIISFTTFTVIGYIIMWIVLPKAETLTQKFEMKGQTADFENIKKNVSEATNNVKSAASSASMRLGGLFTVIGKIILFFIGFTMISMGIALIVGCISIIIALFGGVDLQFFGFVFDHDWQYYLAAIFSFILFLIPSMLLILLGARMISSRIKVNKIFVISSLVIWFLVVISCFILGLSVSRNFLHDIEYVEKKSYEIQSDTITINFTDYKESGNSKFKWIKRNLDDIFEFDGELHKRISDDIVLVPSDNNQITVELTYKSDGKNMDDARKNAESILYKYKVNANGQIDLNKFISLPKGSKFRDQDVDITIHVPKDKTVHTVNVDDVEIYDKYTDSYNYENGKEKFYKFVNDNFSCTNCSGSSKIRYSDNDYNVFEVQADDSVDVKVNQNGIIIKENGKEKVNIDKQQIKISDGTDSVKISLPGN